MWGRIIPWQVETGSFQMAADALMLPLMLRFYGWDQDTLSLGRHQVTERLPLGSPSIPWVRRPTGGRAVLHQVGDAELTYSLVVPSAGLGSRRAAYACLCRFLRLGLAELGVDLDPLDPKDRPERAYWHQPGCFTSRTSADLSWRGLKLVGSAQLWEAGRILQQGSLLLAPDRERWETVLPGSGRAVVGIYEVLGRRIPLPDLIEVLSRAAAKNLGCTWEPLPWTEQEQVRIRQMQPSFEIVTSSRPDP